MMRKSSEPPSLDIYLDEPSNRYGSPEEREARPRAREAIEELRRALERPRIIGIGTTGLTRRSRRTGRDHRIPAGT